MDAQFHFEPAADDVLRLEQAILIYRSGGRRSLATIHPVIQQEERPVILAGSAMTAAATRLLARELLARDGVPYIPSEVLYASADLLVWWAAPATRHLSFRAPELGGAERGARVPLPGTVFMAAGGACRVWAVKGRTRPAPDTALWHAPYFNVAQDGLICWGNVTPPAATGVDRAAAWTGAFFGSYFTHPNAAGKVVHYPGGAYPFWRDMLDGAFRRFPQSVLLPARLTLDAAVRLEWGHA